MKGKRYVFAKHFDGLPKQTDFELVEEELPPVKDGEIMVEALFLSVDPYMRPYSRSLKTGITMIGSQVARVLESKHPDYKKGDNVVGYLGWCTHAVVNPEKTTFLGHEAKLFKLPDFGSLPLSYALGVLGMPGNTAYFGLTKICDPKPGEVLVVSGAAGAVGSLVGQIGKILGLKVIGFAGSDEKVKMLVEELNFDVAYNYKTKNIVEALKESAPNGVDCYFDNVGGVMSNDIMSCMNEFGRVSCCGSISSYNAKEPPMAPVVQLIVIMKQLKLEGFVVRRWTSEWLQGIHKNMEFLKSGKLKVKETIYEGFEKMFEAFLGLFEGDNTGKAIIKV